MANKNLLHREKNKSGNFVDSQDKPFKISTQSCLNFNFNFLLIGFNVMAL